MTTPRFNHQNQSITDTYINQVDKIITDDISSVKASRKKLDKVCASFDSARAKLASETKKKPDRRNKEVYISSFHFCETPLNFIQLF